MPALKSERGVLAIDKRAALLAFATVTSSYTSLTTNSQVALEQLYQNTRTTQLLESYYQQWLAAVTIWSTTTILPPLWTMGYLRDRLGSRDS